MPKLSRASGLLLVLLLLPLASWAQIGWVPGADYDPAVPAPREFLGRALGARHVTVEEAHAYARHLAAVSPLISLEQYGTSVEGDPLLLMAITSSDQPDRLARRQENVAKLVDPRRYARDERRRAADQTPPVTWIACSVHGDEASGVDAGLALAYHLAADRSAATRRILQRSVVVIDVCQNPDGRRRFLTHSRSFRRQRPGADPAPEAAEHHQLWPGGRRNHYAFDLNRDWALLTQQESRARSDAFLRWRPQVVADLHEMGRESTYFFPPPADPVNPHVPEELRQWWDVFGRSNAKAFDTRGFDYFVRETFDLFYPGYGDSWPTLNGAVGMTFEQSTTRGLRMSDRAGQILEFESAVLHHFVAALTTCSTTAEHADDLMDTYLRFHEIALERGAKDPIREDILDPSGRPYETHHLARVLAAQGIEVRRALEPFVATVRPHGGGERSRREFPAGSYRIERQQPSYALLRNLLDPETAMDEDFLRQERSRRERGLSDRFYDVTAWSLIMAHGITAFSSERATEVADEVVLAAAPMPEGKFSSAERPYAYLIPYRDNAALIALIDLWARGIRVWIAQDEFERDGQVYPRGTLVVRASANGDVEGLDEQLADVARTTGADVRAVDGSWTDVGPALGSNRVAFVEQPRVALVTGPGVRPGSAGSLSWLFEVRYQLPYTAMLVATLDRVSLQEYDVLVLPEVSDVELDLPLEILSEWVRGGGTLIAIGKSAQRIVSEEGWSTSRHVRDLRYLDEAQETSETTKAVETAVPSRGDSARASVPPEHRPQRTPGAIFRLDLDTTHFLTLGEGESAYAPVLSDRVFTPSVDGHNVAVYDKESPRAAGFAWPAMEEALAGQAYLVDEPLEAGHVILFAEDPAFRGAWDGLNRLILNAVLLAPSLQR